MRIIVKTVKQILEEAGYALNDTGNSKWPKATMLRVFNMAMQKLDGKVWTPFLYTGIASWDSDAYEYTLPSYVAAGDPRPQFRKPLVVIDGVNYNTSADDPWVDFASYYVEPLATGEWSLRIAYRPPDVDARIIYWAIPGAVPYTSDYYGTITNTPGTSGTTLTFAVTGLANEIAQSGFVSAEGETIQYSGWTKAHSGGNDTITLTNCVRGWGGTTAANLAAASNHKLYWAVGLETETDFAGLLDAICATAHRFYINNTATSDSNFHQQMVSYYDRKFTDFVRARRSKRPIKMVLDSNWNFLD